MQSFSFVIFLVLLEMIRKGDASQDSKAKGNNTYIIRCQHCGRFLFPNALTRSTATGQPLVLIGPVQKLAQNKSMRKNALKLIQNAEKLSIEFREEFLMVEKI